MQRTAPNIRIRIATGDIPVDAYYMALDHGQIALDIETSGLDFRKEQIATCQVYLPHGEVVIVRVGRRAPMRLVQLLANPKVFGLFHHAMFDLRFMYWHWGVLANSVLCTKVCSKILSPGDRSHSLAPLVGHYLGVDLPKQQQKSNWFASELSTEQVIYAARDVVYLPALFMALKKRLVIAERWWLALQSFNYMPTRVMLDVQGSGDVFQY